MQTESRHDICQKIYTAGFSGQKFTPLISPYFNSLGDKNTQKMSGNGEIYTAGKKNYTAAGSDGSDKSHLCWRGGQTPLRLLTVSLIWQNQTNSRT